MSQYSKCNIISPEIFKLPSFNPKINLGILASGKGSNFEALINATTSKLDANIKCLIVNKEKCGAIDIANFHSIPYLILNHRNYVSREELDKQIIKIFKEYNIDIIVMAGWMRIVTPLLIEEFEKRIINIHPSILPSFKGSDAIEQALKAKVKITGCTAHIVNEKVDSGEILIQASVPIEESDDKLSLQKKIQSIEHEILYKAVAIAAINLNN